MKSMVLVMDSELDCAWIRGFDSGYRRAVEIVKLELEQNELLEKLVEKMMKDWSSEHGL